jgi:shikimate kinase
VATVFLDGSVDELFRRCHDQGRPRPLRSDLELFRKLYDARREHYLGASLRVDTSAKTIEAVAIEVVDALGL